MKKALEYGTALIAVYLLVVHASGAGQVMQAGASGTTGVIKAFQGR